MASGWSWIKAQKLLASVTVRRFVHCRRTLSTLDPALDQWKLLHREHDRPASGRCAVSKTVLARFDSESACKNGVVVQREDVGIARRKCEFDPRRLHEWGCRPTGRTRGWQSRNAGSIPAGSTASERTPEVGGRVGDAVLIGSTPIAQTNGESAGAESGPANQTRSVRFRHSPPTHGSREELDVQAVQIGRPWVSAVIAPRRSTPSVRERARFDSEWRL